MEKLNKRLFPLVVALVVLLGVLHPVTARAEWGVPLDYQTLDYKVKYGTEYNTVTVPLPKENYFIRVRDNFTDVDIKTAYGSEYVWFTVNKNDDVKIIVYPASTMGLDLTNIPAGSKLHFDLLVTAHGTNVFQNPVVYERYYYMDAEENWLETDAIQIDAKIGESFSLDYTISSVDGAITFVPSALFSHFYALSDGASYKLTIANVSLEMQVSASYWQQWQSAQTGKAIEELGNKIDSSTDKITGSIEDSTDKITGSIEDSADQVTDAIQDSTDTIVNGTPEQNAQADEAVKEMAQADKELSALGKVFADVEKPNLDQFKYGVGDLVGDSVSVPLLTAPIREIWKSPVALGMLTIVVTLVMVSWIFFGKKN